jgi:membrane protein DedA with SNARE-associated domain
MGKMVGQNWERIGVYLATYSQTVTAVIILVVLVLVVKYIYGRKKKKRNSR